jgi:hypothetical protein
MIVRAVSIAPPDSTRRMSGHGLNVLRADEREDVVLHARNVRVAWSALHPDFLAACHSRAIASKESTAGVVRAAHCALGTTLASTDELPEPVKGIEL